MFKNIILASVLIFGISCISPPPQKFVANIPKEAVEIKSDDGAPIKSATVLSVKKDGTIFFMNEKIGTIDDTGKLEKELTKIFEERKKSNDKDATTVFV